MGKEVYPNREFTDKQIETAINDLLIIFAMGLKKGWAPTIEELMEPFGLHTKSAVNSRLKKIQLLGWIEREPESSRAMRVTNVGENAVANYMIEVFKNSY